MILHICNAAEHACPRYTFARFILQSATWACTRRKLAHNITLKLHGDEDNLALCGLGHRLKCFKLTDLHGSRAREDVSGLPHEARSVDFGTSSNDLRLTNPLLLSSGRERRGNISCEDNVLDPRDNRSVWYSIRYGKVFERSMLFICVLGREVGESSKYSQDAFDRNTPFLLIRV